MTCFGTIRFPEDVTIENVEIQGNYVHLYAKGDPKLKLEELTFNICGETFKIEDRKYVDSGPEIVQCCGS